MGKHRFRVRLVRPVFQYVDVEVEAGEYRIFKISQHRRQMLAGE